MFETIRIETDARGVAHLWLAREDKHNALSAQMIRELIIALDQVQADASLRFLVLRARGKHFSAGADLAWMQQSAELDYHTNLDDARHLAELMEYGSEYSFVPAGQTGAMYQERLKQLPELRRKVLADFKPFRDGRVKGNALLDGLIAADLDPNSGIVLEQELMTFFAAGAETTAATVGWACDMLAMPTTRPLGPRALSSPSSPSTS